MKKEFKCLSFIILITMFIASFIGCSNKNISTKETNIKSTDASQTISKDIEFKRKLAEVKRRITSLEVSLPSDADDINNFIDENINRDEVKNGLCNFIVEQWNIFSKSGKENISDNLVASLLKIKLDYPNNADVEKAYVQYSKYQSKLASKEVNTIVESSKNLTSSDGTLELLDYKSEDGYIVGNIKNNSSESYRYVEVNIILLDKEGNQVGSTLTNVENLQANSTWKFKAVVIETNVSKFKIVSINSNK